MAPRPIDEARFLRVLGDEIRAARKQHGMVRREVARLLHPPVSTQTLATYELGTRDAPITRFVGVCLAVGELPADVLRRTWERVINDPNKIAGWNVDLVVAARLPDANLAPLAAWAAVQLRAAEYRTTAHLTRAAIDPLAALCGLEWRDLARRLPHPADPTAGR